MQQTFIPRPLGVTSSTISSTVTLFTPRSLIVSRHRTLISSLQPHSVNRRRSSSLNLKPKRVICIKRSLSLIYISLKKKTQIDGKTSISYRSNMSGLNTVPLLVSLYGKVLVDCPFVDISLPFVIIIVHMVNAVNLFGTIHQPDVCNSKTTSRIP